MSHGPSTGGPSADPNLTPLLDVVLQLVMFFMINVSFVAEQFTTKDVVLPESQSARPLDIKEKKVLFLNLNSKGELVLPRLTSESPKDPIADRAEMARYLKDEYDEADRNDKEPGGGARMLVIIRADRDTEYLHVYDLLRLCKDQKFRKLQLRAVIENK